MKIKLSPVRMDVGLSASVSGDVLTVNGIAIDLSPLEEGSMLPSSAIDSPWVSGDITRTDGVISLTLNLPHGANAPYETRFPAAYTVPITVTEGPIPLPAYDNHETKSEQEYEPS